jgi:TRAP-type C4-dicarboxylate transport system permease small subunit
MAAPGALDAVVLGCGGAGSAAAWRLAQRGRRVLLGVSEVVSAGVFLWFAAGSLWIAAEMRHGHEHSELLRIPWSWLRVTWIAASLLIAAVFLARALRGFGKRS